MKNLLTTGVFLFLGLGTLPALAITVPFDGCEKDFGSGENIWFFCPDYTATFKTSALSTTENALIQSLPVHSRIRVGFACKTSLPASTKLSLGNQELIVAQESTLKLQEFDLAINYEDAGLLEWKLETSFRKKDLSSIKKGCEIQVSGIVSYAHVPTIKSYTEYLAKDVTDLGNIAAAISDVATADLSEVRNNLDAAIKNTQATLDKATDASARLLLNQSLRKLKSTLASITQACSAQGTAQCTKALATANSNINSDLTDKSGELSTIKDFLADEVKRLNGVEESIKSELQAILDGL